MILSHKTGAYIVVPLSAMPQKKLGRTDGELIAPPALHNLKQLGDMQRPRSLTRILPKRVKSERNQEKRISLALNQPFNAARALTPSPTKHFVDARDQRDDTMDTTCEYRDESGDDSVEILTVYCSNENESIIDAHDKNFLGRTLTPPPSTWGWDKAESLFKKMSSRCQLYKKDIHDAEVEENAVEIVLLLWTANMLRVKIVDGTNQFYLKHDETQGKSKVSSKSHEEEPTMVASTDTWTFSSNSISNDASGEESDDTEKDKVVIKSGEEGPTKVVPTDTWTISSNSIAEDASGEEEDDDDDEGALRPFFCGMFCQEKDIPEVESSESFGPDDIPSEISYRCHHHHHAHAKYMRDVQSNDLPLATSMVVSDVSSSSSETSDWSSECSSMKSKSKECTIDPEEHDIKFVNHGRQRVKRGKWKNFLSKFHSNHQTKNRPFD